MARAPKPRARLENDHPVRPGKRLVLYWMTAARRTTHSFALDHAIDWARSLKRPLVVLEALRCDYPHASDRLHDFILRGMADNRARLEGQPALYFPFVERRHGEGKGLLATLAEESCVVVTDRSPAFFLPRMLAAAGREIEARLESIDGCGLLPLAAAPKPFARAHDFRRFLSRSLGEHLGTRPRARPFARVDLPRLDSLHRTILERWPPADDALLAGEGLQKLPLDHGVHPVSTRGGSKAGTRRLRDFIDRELPGYIDSQRHPDKGSTSGISPYLHYGHIGAHQVIADLERRGGFSLRGGPEDWSRMKDSTAAFLDQLVTWRELGYVHSSKRDDAARFSGLPPWCKETLRRHLTDQRPALYDVDALEGAKTHDEIWNAAQRQLLHEGRVHSYLRMIWGKRVIEWTADPEEAFERLVLLNDRFALDGRDPNSYSGIGWCFGRFDRPWPTRPVYGQVRYMSSEQTKKKLRMRSYLERWSGE